MIGVMDLELFTTKGLGDASYLIASDGEAALVDPQRDAWRFLAAAERAGPAGAPRPRDPRPQRLPVRRPRGPGRDGRRDRGSSARRLRLRPPRSRRGHDGRGRRAAPDRGGDARPYPRAPRPRG